MKPNISSLILSALSDASTLPTNSPHTGYCCDGVNVRHECTEYICHDVALVNLRG